MTKNFKGSKKTNKKKKNPTKELPLGHHQISQQKLQARQEQNDILKILNDKKMSARNTLSSKVVLQENEDCPG